MYKNMDESILVDEAVILLLTVTFQEEVFCFVTRELVGRSVPPSGKIILIHSQSCTVGVQTIFR